MDLHAHFSNFIEQLNNGRLFWNEGLARHYLTNQPFSGLNSFLLGTNPLNDENKYWIDDYSLKSLNLSANGTVQNIFNFTSIGDHKKLTAYPLYNCAEIENLPPPPELIAVPPFEIISHYNIPYDNKATKDIEYQAQSKNLKIPTFAANQDLEKFFFQLASFVYFSYETKPYTYETKIIIDLLRARLATKFGYDLRPKCVNFYIIEQLLKLNLLKNKEGQEQVLGYFNLTSRLCDLLESQLFNDLKLIKDIEVILPVKTRNELLRGLNSSDKKAYQIIINKLKKKLDIMNANTKENKYFFRYIMTFDDKFVEFFLTRILEGYLYEGVMFSENKTIMLLEKDEIDQFELDLNL